MPQVTLTKDSSAGKRGETIEVDDQRARFLTTYGYATEQTTPNNSAMKSEWVGHAVRLGATRDEADALTKAELIETYGV